MRHALPTALALLVSAAAIVYALLNVASDLRHVSDDLDVVARNMTTMADDVRSIADDVNAIADAIAGEPEDDNQQQATGVIRRVRARRPAVARRARRGQAHVRVGVAAVSSAP